MGDDGEDLLSALIATFSDEEELEAIVKGDETTSHSFQYKPETSQDASTSSRKLEEVDMFSSTKSPSRVSKKGSAEELKEQLFGDISDEEETLMSEKKESLNEHGMELQKLMKVREQDHVTSSSFHDKKAAVTNKWNTSSRVAHQPNEDKFVRDHLAGLRIVNPKISMDFLKRASHAKEYLQLSKAPLYAPKLIKEKRDWITIGVLASKTETKRSAKSNSTYIIFRLVDMADTDREVSLFLFGSCYEQHWKLPVSSVLGLLNPSTMNSDKKDELTLSLNQPGQLLVIGTSKDFGYCRSVTKNGNVCTKVVNKYVCDKCKFHVMKEHKSMSHQRSELNAGFSSKVPESTRTRLLQKISTSKSSEECVTYGGKSYNLKPAKPKTSVNLKGVLSRAVNKGNLQSTLNLYNIKAEDQQKIEAVRDMQKTKAEKHLEELISKPSNASMQFMQHLINKELGSSKKSSDTGVTTKSVTAAELIKMENKKFEVHKKRQASGLVLLDSPATTNSQSASPSCSMSVEEYKQWRLKRRAAQIVSAKGGIKKEDANATRKSLTSEQKEQIKRRLNSSQDEKSNSGDENSQPSSKKKKMDALDINSEEYQAIRNKKSANAHLVQQVEDDREAEYFNTLQKKESYETKLLGTQCIECPIFYCIICDYTDWSLGKKCKEENHKYRKLPALKRFFKCSKCKERAVTWERYPTHACKKCGARSYDKAGMINEKKVVLAGEELSLRGNEETRLGVYDSKVNLDIS